MEDILERLEKGRDEKKWMGWEKYMEVNTRKTEKGRKEKKCLIKKRKNTWKLY